jgi:hypothetical protein
MVQNMEPQLLDAGEYDYEIGTDLAGGVYCVNIKAGAQSLARKIVIY